MTVGGQSARNMPNSQISQTGQINQPNRINIWDQGTANKPSTNQQIMRPNRYKVNWLETWTPRKVYPTWHPEEIDSSRNGFIPENSEVAEQMTTQAISTSSTPFIFRKPNITFRIPPTTTTTKSEVNQRVSLYSPRDQATSSAMHHIQPNPAVIDTNSNVQSKENNNANSISINKSSQIQQNRGESLAKPLTIEEKVQQELVTMLWKPTAGTYPAIILPHQQLTTVTVRRSNDLYTVTGQPHNVQIKNGNSHKFPVIIVPDTQQVGNQPEKASENIVPSKFLRIYTVTKELVC